MPLKRRIVIYLDTSVYNRPFDDQGQVRVRLETEAFLTILGKVVRGALTIIGSSALQYENSRNPFAVRKERVSGYLNMASKVVTLSEPVKKRALALVRSGVDAVDAIHLACAETGGAEYFITCDDGIVRKTRKGKAVVAMKVCKPLEFILEEVFHDA